MKKLTTIVAIILLFSMLLCNCNYVKDPPEESGPPSATPKESDNETELQNPTETPDLGGEETPKESDNETVSTNPPEQKYVIDPGYLMKDLPTGSIWPLELMSIEEYENFINTAEPIDGFVRYERIQSLGEFFALQIFTYYSDILHYVYWLKDYETGCEIVLSANKDKLKNDISVKKTLSTDVVDINDMRTISEKKSGMFTIDGISYLYSGGNLRQIQWVENDTYFYLSPNLSTYPLSQSSAIGKLMNANNATDVLGQMFEIDTTQRNYTVDFNLSISYTEYRNYCRINYYSIDDFKNSLDDKEWMCSELAKLKVPDRTIEPLEVFFETYQPQDAIFPYWLDEPIKLQTNDTKIAIYPEDCYGLTWIAYFSDYRKDEVRELYNHFIKIAYIPDSILESKDDLTAADVLKELSPDSVGVDNLGSYHKAVHNINLMLEEREVSALIIEYQDRPLETVIFVYDNRLVVVGVDMDSWLIPMFWCFKFRPLP